jgi:hypothetical protein
MKDAAQIRRSNGATRANHSLFRPPPEAPRPNPKISNRESLRLETVVTQTKERIGTRSNREKEACFRITPSRPARLPNLKISNRESARRVRADDPARRNDEVTPVTQTKERIGATSNRENNARFSNRVRADDSARRNIGHRTRLPNPKISNPESIRLEIHLTHRKQTIAYRSNREKEACFSASKPERTGGPPTQSRGMGSRRPRFGTGCWFGPPGKTHVHTGGIAAHPNPHRAGGEPRPLRRRDRRARFAFNTIFDAKQPKKRIRDPRVLLRLNRSPIVCFVRLSGDFNRTLLRVRRRQCE